MASTWNFWQQSHDLWDPPALHVPNHRVSIHLQEVSRHHTWYRRAGKPAVQQVEPAFLIFLLEWQTYQSHSGKLLIQCKLTLIISTCWWGKCFCRLCIGTGIAYACSFKIKPVHLVSYFLIIAMRQDVPLTTTMRNVPPCANAWFSSHLHNCVHRCCTDMVLKGCRCTTWNTAVLSPISTYNILENQNLSDRQQFLFLTSIAAWSHLWWWGIPALGSLKFSGITLVK